MCASPLQEMKPFVLHIPKRLKRSKKPAQNLSFSAHCTIKACLKISAGCICPGGYPELCAKALSENTEMLLCIKTAIKNSLPTVAECGGFLYLGQTLEDVNGDKYRMAGVLPGEGFKVGHLVRFGYATLTAKGNSMLLKKDELLPVHEFHHWDSTENGIACTAIKPNGRTWDCAFANEHFYAGFPHLYWAGTPLPQRFADAARRYMRDEI